jgi:ribosomal protein L40E
MAKVEAAEHRLFKNIFICRKCKRKVRAPIMKVLRGKVTCRKCTSSALRPKRKK